MRVCVCVNPTILNGFRSKRLCFTMAGELSSLYIKARLVSTKFWISDESVRCSRLLLRRGRIPDRELGFRYTCTSACVYVCVCAHARAFVLVKCFKLIILRKNTTVIIVVIKQATYNVD